MIRRFRRTLLALGALVAIALVALAVERRPPPADVVAPDAVFRFEKEDLASFSVTHRPDGQDLSFRRVDGQWETDGQPWRPSASMVRRVAHQLHDLTARADVVEAEGADLERYGLGPDALQVTIGLRDGRTLAFAVGDPNPTSVSWYMRPLPDGRIYVVKKSAMDFWRSPVEDFREDRVVSFDADEVERLLAVVDGRAIDVERVGDRVYHLHAPVDEPADRDVVRRMLGRLSSLRATRFVEDGHERLEPAWGLDPPQHTFEVRTAAATPIVVHLGAAVAGDPPLRYAWIGGDDDEVVLVRDGLLEAFELPPEEMRDHELLPSGHEWDVASFDATRAGETLTLTRTADDDWRWADGAAVPGATPKRLASRAAELRAITFFDDGVPPSGRSFGLDPPWGTVALRFSDGTEHRVDLGDRFPVEVTEPSPPDPRDPGHLPEPVTRTVDHQFAQVDGGTPVEVSGELGDSVADLFREHGRKEERDAEKHLSPR